MSFPTKGEENYWHVKAALITAPYADIQASAAL